MCAQGACCMGHLCSLPRRDVGGESAWQTLPRRPECPGAPWPHFCSGAGNHSKGTGVPPTPIDASQAPGHWSVPATGPGSEGWGGTFLHQPPARRESSRGQGARGGPAVGCAALTDADVRISRASARRLRCADVTPTPALSLGAPRTDGHPAVQPRTPTPVYPSQLQAVARALDDGFRSWPSPRLASGSDASVAGGFREQGCDHGQGRCGAEGQRDTRTLCLASGVLPTGYRLEGMALGWPPGQG